MFYPISPVDSRLNQVKLVAICESNEWRLDFKKEKKSHALYFTPKSFCSVDCSPLSRQVTHFLSQFNTFGRVRLYRKII